MAHPYTPDFFVLGAPKCGTTSLYEGLIQHPDVFMPTNKEPHFFSSDFPEHRKVTTEEAYRSIFEDARDDQVSGEASVWYLYSQEAVRNIVKRRGDCRFIVMVRRQIDMLPSLWSQLRYVVKEDTASFEEAWRLRDARRSGVSIPANSDIDGQTIYDGVANYGAMITRLRQMVPDGQIEVVFFEDLMQRPDAVTSRIARFLNLSIDHPLKLPHSNSRKKHNYPRLSAALMRPSGPLASLKSVAKRVSPMLTKRIGTKVYSALSSPEEKPTVSQDICREIVQAYSKDINLLESITGRCLRHWTQI